MLASKFELLSDDLRKVVSELGFDRETPVQTQAIPAILEGQNVLIISPTGSGKTEAALLPILEKIRLKTMGDGIKLIYITPLRALNRDMLERIEKWAMRLGLSAAVRHGDTSQSERRKQALSPPDILITTPETLQVILVGSRLRASLKNLTSVVVDEIHQLASDRRGSQLSFGLARLERIVGRNFQRVGLSATVANAEEIGQFLSGVSRKFRIVDASSVQKQFLYRVELPKPTREDELQSRELFISPQTMARIHRIIDLIEGHERTLVFVNSRTLAEELGSRLHLLGIKVGVHHGSLPKEERERTEEEFKERKLRALICTGTLELGIDIGSVDLVIQYMSPRQVNSLIQRVGRSGHNLARRSEGIVLAVSPEDSLEATGISSEALDGKLEPTFVYRAPMDVLAHQVAGLLMEQGEIELETVLEIARSSYSFRSLTKNDLSSVVKFMETMGYLTIDGEKITRRRKCREYYFENLSTIRDERRYSVINLTTQEKIGILGEEFMVLHAEVGLHFIIKGRAWQIESIQEEKVYVTPVKDPGAAVPGWDGELIPIPESVARTIGFVRREIETSFSNKTSRTSEEFPNIEKSARDSFVEETRIQSRTSSVPTDMKIVVESFRNYLVVHTSAGDRVNLTLGELFEERLLRMGGLVRNWWSDGYRILIELSTGEVDLESVTEKIFHYDPTLISFIDGVMRKHFPFGYEMKFIAERFGALKRGRMLSGDALKELGVKFRFTPIYEETMREAYATKIDIQRTVEILKAIGDGSLKLETKHLENPSPLAMYILSRYADSEDYRDAGLDSVESMKAAANKEVVSLLCMECANLKEFVRVGDLPESPACEKCSSRLLAVLFFGARFAASSLAKKRSGDVITKEEREAISKARRSADIVLSYGKKGMLAQSIYGVGPQMAARILSKMHESEQEFYEDLMEAEIKFIETKKYWG